MCGPTSCCAAGQHEWSKWHDAGGLTIPGNIAKDYSGGRIERIDIATGKVERVYDKVDGVELRGPNDIVFDKAGDMWFTDLGKNHHRSIERGGVYRARRDGSKISEIAYGGTGFNGIGLSPDEKVVYAAETDTGFYTTLYEELSVCQRELDALAKQLDEKCGVDASGTPQGPSLGDLRQALADYLTAVADSPNAASFKSYQGRFLLLPTGEVLLTAYSARSRENAR